MAEIEHLQPKGNLGLMLNRYPGRAAQMGAPAPIALLDWRPAGAHGDEKGRE
jgi:hypothetical protein